MSAYDSLLQKLPSIAQPKVYLSFKSRLKWTGGILLLYLVLAQITVYGISVAEKQRFQFLELILGANIGSLMTLGIGPIVTASIILQLLVGSKVLPWDLKTEEGRMRFQGTQKIVTMIFAFIEAYAFVSFGVIAPVDSSVGTMALLILQLAFGGFIVLLMDEVVSKWGIGSGVSLFIAAGVSRQIFISLFSPIVPAGTSVPSGVIPAFVTYLQLGEVAPAFLTLLPLLGTVLVFFFVVYIQAIKVDIPLAFASIRGFGRRWPLKFLYTSNMPVILAAALVANFNLIGSSLAARGFSFIGEYDSNGIPISGIMSFISPPRSVELQLFVIIFIGITFIGSFAAYLTKSPKIMKISIASAILGFVIALVVSAMTLGMPLLPDSIRAITYLIFFSAVCTVFSVIWVSTAGMDSDSVSSQIEDLGLQVPGFRRDPRIIRDILNRYIPMLSVLGGITVGALAAVADLTNAIGTGTGLLLTVMIIFNFYEIIAARYMEDMHPALRKFFE
ncbi:MAG: preprotein translocase subunit SecY [Candidatus Aenigmarchaeota archaeon]|nr:preprotein translocase subunit SecY [Candidatus Aenigmarchaeota archaeon]